MRRLFRPAIVSFGIATLCLLAILGPLISPWHGVIYHTSGPVLTIFAAVLADLFVLWALITAALIVAEKPGWRQVAIWSALVLALPWILLKNASMLAGFMLPNWASASVLALSLVALVSVAVFWKPSFFPTFRRIKRLLTVVFGFVALSGVIFVGQLLWFGWQARALNSPVLLHQRRAAPLGRAGGRVIWILLDELSYQQVYEQRFPGLSLPAFDALARESTSFTHVVPAGRFTEEVIPSLFTGLAVDRIRVSADGRRLSLRDPVARRWQTFDPRQTIFQDALNAGYSTAAAGWYNPYCRLLPEVLDRCFWTFQLPYPGGIIAGGPFARNVLQLLVRRLRPALANAALDTESHIEDYRELRGAADAILADPDASFVFLHMPIPHPGGIYDRRNKSLTTGPSSYIDNLALADKYLARVRGLLERRGEWDPSTIVIMGDHSWRTSFIWSTSEGWTREDEAASHGAQFDGRPVYMVKLPHQQQASRIDAPFKAIHTRSLLDALIAGQLRTVDDLHSWARKQK
jgi:hypothetical protein